MFRGGAKTILVPATLILVAATLILFALNLSARPPVASQPSGALPCRVLEAHTDTQLGVTVVLFHHRDPSARVRLGALLREHSGESAQFQIADGKWHAATVLRLKSCFGRGVLLFPAGTAQLAERDEFLLQFPSGPGK